MASEIVNRTFENVTDKNVPEELLKLKLQIDILSRDHTDFENRMIENVNTFFLVVVSILIYLMQCGFAFLEAGSVRSKNTVNILIKNLLDSFVSGLSYWLVGYAFAFGEGNAFIGHWWFAHSWIPGAKLAHWFFHYVFAATAATIVSGAVAERCDFNAYLIYSFVLTGFVYPVVTHWAWDGQGWLFRGIEYGNQTVGYQDFAGSGVVHTVGGVVAFVGAALLGPRKGKFIDGVPQELRGHSIPLASLGGFILLFGFFAFNGGSQAEISSQGAGVAVARSIVNTVLAATGGGFTTLLLNKTGLFGDAKWSLLTTLNGCLAGMVSVCAGCNAIYSYAGFVTGCIGGISYMCFTWIVLRVKVNDPLDATAVHFGGGIVGVLTVPLFDFDHGVFYNGDNLSGVYLGWNVVGLLAIIAWSATFALAIFGTLRLFRMLRVSDEYEEKGLDYPKHGEAAYPPESYGHGWGEKGDQVSKLLANMLPMAAVGKQARLRKNAETPEVAAMRKTRENQVGVHIVEENNSTNM